MLASGRTRRNVGPRGRFPSQTLHRTDFPMHIPFAARIPGLLLAFCLAFAAHGATSLRIVRQPVTLGVFAGGSTELSVVAESDGPLGYQWYFGTNALVGSADGFFTNTTSPVLTFNNTSVTNAGDYSVVVTSGSLSARSSTATLKVLVGLPSILRLANATNSVVTRTNVVADGSGTTTNVTTWNRHDIPVIFTIQGDDRSVGLTLAYTNVVSNPEFQFTSEYGSDTNVVLWTRYHPTGLSFLLSLTNGVVFTNLSQQIGVLSFDSPTNYTPLEALVAARISVVTALPSTNLVSPFMSLPSGSRRVYGTNEGVFPMSVLLQPQVANVGEVALDRQTGYFRQAAEVVNISGEDLADVRLLVAGLTNDTRSIPVSLVTSIGPVGTPPVPSLFLGPLSAYGGPRRFQLEYYVSDGLASSIGKPGYVAESATLYSVTTVTGRRSITPVPTVLTNGVLLEFPTLTNFSYYVRYSDTLGAFSAQTTNDTAILTASPAFRGNGRTVQWLDNGPPRTVSVPSTNRFYRVLEFR